MIGEENIAVEINKSKFGKVKYHRGHRVKEVWVFGIIERTPKRRIIFVSVNNRKAATLTTIIQRFLYPGSIIHSNCFKSYSKL